jgi:hypothetical protein
MIRTRRLHARLAYVMRVDDLANVAYAAANARSVCRGLRAQRTPRPSVARGSMVKNVDPAGLRIACLAYSLGTQAHMIRTRRLHARLCASLGIVFGASPNTATITYNAKASVLAARQHAMQSLLTRRISTRITKEW